MSIYRRIRHHPTIILKGAGIDKLQVPFRVFAIFDEVNKINGLYIWVGDNFKNSMNNKEEIECNNRE